jgi:hypothetical protein
MSQSELIRIHDSLQQHEFGTILVPIDEILLVASHREDSDDGNVEVGNVNLRRICWYVVAHYWILDCHGTVT